MPLSLSGLKAKIKSVKGRIADLCKKEGEEGLTAEEAALLAYLEGEEQEIEVEIQKLEKSMTRKPKR